IGKVRAVSEDDKNSTEADINAEGEYSIPNAPLGNVKLAVLPPPPLPDFSPPADIADKGKGKEFAEKMKQKIPDKMPDAAEMKELEKRHATIKNMPGKYKDFRSSGITTRVESGGSTYAIELKSR